jgi:hypothetical protein
MSLRRVLEYEPMKTKSLLFALAALLALVACATSTRIHYVHERHSQLRDAMAVAVSDPARRAQVLTAVDGMEVAVAAVIEENERLNEEFVATSADPDADPDRLRALAKEVAAARRDGMRQFLAVRLDLRREMTAEEWAKFVRALPAFDGGGS